MVISKKKDLHLDSVAYFSIFVPKLRCSLKIKEKEKGLHLDLVAFFSIFVPKSRCSLKKKRKALHLNLVTNFCD